ncbi:MAG: hypothetical protein ACKOI0_06385 [Actinomycetota bacterium]
MERLQVVEGSRSEVAHESVVRGLPGVGTLPLVSVRWLDAWFDVDLEDAAAARDDYPVVTVGFLLRTGPVVSIAQEVLPDGDGYRAVTHVPRQLIVAIDRLDGGPPVDA